MTKGRMSQTEKYAIQGAIHEGKDTPEIAKMLGRSEKAVQNYVDGELDDLMGTIAKVAINTTPTPEQIDETNRPPEPRMKAGDLMGKKTSAKGEEGAVSIMTEAASAVGDDFRKNMPKRRTTRTSSGNVYDIKKQKILKDE